MDRWFPGTSEIVPQHVGIEGNLAVLSPFIYEAFPLVNRTRGRWKLRFNSMWMPEVLLFDQSRLDPTRSDDRSYLGWDHRFRDVMDRCELKGKLRWYLAHRCGEGSEADGEGGT